MAIAVREATGERSLGSLIDVEALLVKADEYDKKAEECTRKAAAIRQIVAGFHALNGDAESVLHRSFPAHRTIFELRAPDEFGLRGPAAVVKVMSERPDAVWKVVEVKREMLRRGWAPTPKAVEASIKRLRERGEVVLVSYGHYKLASHAEATQAHDEPEAVIA